MSERFTAGGPWIQTFTGRAVHLLDPSPADVAIEDIAHSLSHICRYTGHVEMFYSVGEHSLWASFLAPPQHRLAALLHDATEAYVNDLSKPLKNLLPQYEEIERLHWIAVANKFELSHELPAEVKRIDKELLMAEHHVLMKKAPAPWGYANVVPTPGFKPLCMAPIVCEIAFLQRYLELTNREI